MCREVARSAELRTFLQVTGELRRSTAWMALHAPVPTWRHGVQRLLKQMVGREALTPGPAEAARATGTSHDVVRTCREAVYGYRHRGCVFHLCMGSVRRDARVPGGKLPVVAPAGTTACSVPQIGGTWCPHCVVKSTRHVGTLPTPPPGELLRFRRAQHVACADVPDGGGGCATA